MSDVSIACSKCGQLTPSSKDVFLTVCHKCQGALLLQYDLKQISRSTPRTVFEERDDTFWKFIEFLPIQPENIVSLEEPYTPIFQLPPSHSKFFGNVYIKDDGRLPTGTFKARGMAVVVSKLKELGAKRDVVIPSAGNAASALSAYASRIGLNVFAFMPKDVPESNLKECIYLGAKVKLVEGTIDNVSEALKKYARAHDWVDVSTSKQPYRFEGYKVAAFELAEQFNWDLPDNIFFPTGGGEGVIGLWKGFKELSELGWIERIPRLIIVQSSGCAPLVEAYEKKQSEVEEPWKNPETIAAGLRVPYPYASYLVLRAVKETKGKAMAVDDNDIIHSMKDLFKMGVYACPEAASTLAALTKLDNEGHYDSEEKTLLYITGTAMKYFHLMKTNNDLTEHD